MVYTYCKRKVHNTAHTRPVTKVIPQWRYTPDSETAGAVSPLIPVSADSFQSKALQRNKRTESHHHRQLRCCVSHKNRIFANSSDYSWETIQASTASEAYEHACNGGADKIHEKQRGQPLHVPDGSNLYTHAAHRHTHPFKILGTPPNCRRLNRLDGQLLFEV